MGLSLRDTLIDEPAKRPHSRARLESLRSICKVAILGFGTVGKAVTELLCCSPSLQLRLTHIYNRNVDRKRVPWVPSQVRWTDNFDEILASDVDEIVSPTHLAQYPRNPFPIHIAVVNMREAKLKRRTAT